jgi:hypothetical protein
VVMEICQYLVHFIIASVLREYAWTIIRIGDRFR